VNPRWSSVSLVATAVAVVLVGAPACAGDSAGSGGSGGESASTTTTSTTTTTSSSTSSGSGGGFNTDCVSQTYDPPPAIPDDWQSYTCWPGCTYWLPPNTESMPEPISWEPCPDLGQWPRGECMRNTWDDGEGVGIAFAPNVDTSIPGSPRIQVTRGAVSGLAEIQRYYDWIVARADGPVEFAARSQWGSGCGMYEGGVRGKHAAWSLVETTGSVVDGLLLLDVDSRTLLSGYPDENELITSWVAGDGWAVRDDGRLTAIRPDGSEERIVHQAGTDPNGLGVNGKAIVVGDEIVYPVGNYSYTGFYGFHPEHGTRALVTFPNDLTRGAGNVGTDGNDLVWSLGENRPPGEVGYPDLSIYTAPFTTDPAALQPRRLRRDMANDTGTFEKQFAVGCGFAGRYIAASGLDSQLVRLSDGVAWRFTGVQLKFRWNRVLGISCEHAYVQANYDAIGKGSPGQRTIVRVRLDELGEGLPAD